MVARDEEVKQDVRRTVERERKNNQNASSSFSGSWMPRNVGWVLEFLLLYCLINYTKKLF